MDLQAAKPHLEASAFLAFKTRFVNAHSLPPSNALLAPFPLQQSTSTPRFQTNTS